MTQVPGEVRWLSDTEMAAWRSYIVSTLRLRQCLHRELVESHDVSLIDYEVLVCLSQAPENRMRMTELATMLGSTKSRLSHQVGRMELAGYVRRGKDPGDRRGVTAELTKAGEELLESAAPTHVRGVRAHLIDLMSTEEQVTMGKVFNRVLTHLTEQDD
ncbi:MarR family transcriptional regulator [Prauserella sp. PE36]|uniref:MarR family transcriptional regulator n=1 Tax=Prauserella endophytica TaxID=1592324 RepID=A0ABY2SC69_9PSEU|nr:MULTISPECIES: MarR family transcriptional regulator [Prauserella]PXY34963.1 MarR family transcriptional regulator [Prauserella coralliicola]RBM19257.1 MarR family transcriptional regulator [Prauserella sp. PE36]TKG73492.1 MarR family transcriptional regulator [Prauserella endophytica]